MALTTERDLGSLLELILSQARRVTGADAGSLYLVERDDDGAPTRLRFASSQNHSLPALPFSSYTVPIDHSSLAGYAAATGEPLVIGDVYLLPDGASYKQNRSFDETFGYRTKSMLVLPMKTHRDEVIGVLQLINRKADPDARALDARTPSSARWCRSTRTASSWRRRSRRRRRSRSRTAGCTRTSSGCSRASSPPRSRRSNRATRRRRVIRAASRR